MNLSFSSNRFSSLSNSSAEKHAIDQTLLLYSSPSFVNKIYSFKTYQVLSLMIELGVT